MRVLILTEDRTLSLKLTGILNRWKVSYDVYCPTRGLMYCDADKFTHVIYGTSSPPYDCPRGIPPNISDLNMYKMYIGNAMVEYGNEAGLKIEHNNDGAMLAEYPKSCVSHSMIDGRLMSFNTRSIYCCLSSTCTAFEDVFRRFIKNTFIQSTIPNLKNIR